MIFILACILVLVVSFLLSNEAVDDSIRSNEYEFLETGKKAQ